MIKAIFFDFDGVIMDTMELKADSYCYAFKPFQLSPAKIRDLQYLYAGLSRKRILRLIYEQLSGQKATDGVICELLARFAEHDEQSRSLMVPIPGSLTFLKAIYPHFYTAVVTGTPQSVIERTISYHHLTTYFDDVRGSPQSKQSIIEELLAVNDLTCGQCLLIGDGKTDQDAAEACSIRFVGFDRGKIILDPSRAWLMVSSLMELLPHLSSA